MEEDVPAQEEFAQSPISVEHAAAITLQDLGADGELLV